MQAEIGQPTLAAPVLSATTARTNGELVAEAARLGYLNGRVLDPTYGRGKWWTDYQPDELVWHTDRHPDGTPTGFDFRDIPHPDATFDTVAWDPPYVPPGGRSTSTVPDFHDRFGLADTPGSPEAQHAYNMDGAREAARVLRPGGYLLWKCMDYVHWMRYYPVTAWVERDAAGLGLETADKFVHLSGTGPQPLLNRDGTARVQRHSRRNWSMLIVFRKTAVPPPTLF